MGGSRLADLRAHWFGHPAGCGWFGQGDFPATLFSLIGGALADKWDQRRLLIGVQISQMTVLAVLASLTLTEVIEVWQVFLLISVASGLQSFENPARQAIFPRLVPRDALMDAVSLNATVHPGARFLGPVMGGLLMAVVSETAGLPLAGAAALFYLTAFGHLLNFRLLSWIHLPAVQRKSTDESIYRDLRHGTPRRWPRRRFSPRSSA